MLFDSMDRIITHFDLKKQLLFEENEKFKDQINGNNYSSHQSEMEIESIPNDMITHILINDNSLDELYKQIHFLIYMKINFEK